MTLEADGINYFQILPGDMAADRAGLSGLEMDTLVLRVASELAPAEIPIGWTGMRSRFRRSWPPRSRSSPPPVKETT